MKTTTTHETSTSFNLRELQDRLSKEIQLTDLDHKVIIRRVDSVRRSWAEYEEAQEAEYRKGFRPEYCYHGAYLWDLGADVPCSYCEYGETSFNYLEELARAKAYRKGELVNIEAVQLVWQLIHELDSEAADILLRKIIITRYGLPTNVM